ncbi:MAG: hypothetical protein IPL39_14375 [Opitutaceae bacterium]|nr:hypothetical protein [Opitutaceae bacterium]
MRTAMMTAEEHRRMAACEDTLWHYVALHGQVRRALRRSRLPATAALLDAGCGTGGLLRRLSGWWPQASLRGGVFGLRGGAGARAHGMPYRRGLGARAAFPGRQLRCDHLNRCGVPVSGAGGGLPRIRALPTLGGVVVVNEPAHRWLFSYHDVSVGGRHRFARSELEGMLRSAGLEPVYATHWNFLPLPLVWVRRRLLPAPQGSDVGEYPWWVRGPMRAMMALERLWLDLGGRFPCGVSVLVAARKAG